MIHNEDRVLTTIFWFQIEQSFPKVHKLPHLETLSHYRFQILDNYKNIFIISRYLRDAVEYGKAIKAPIIGRCKFREFRCTDAHADSAYH